MSRRKGTENPNFVDESDAIQRQASSWLARLESGRASVRDHHAFHRWVTCDTRHRDAVESIRSSWLRFDALAELPQSRKQRLFASAEVDESERVSIASSHVARSRRRSRAWAAVAAIAMVGGALAYRDAAGEYSTGVGERESLHLADGSTVTLNTNSRVAVRLTDSLRTVTLESGEAYFQIAPDASRPFVVRVGEHEVRALGTAFNVRLRGDDFVVVLTEGVVEVEGPAVDDAAAEPASAGVRLEPGQRIDVRDRVDRARRVEARPSELSWRQGYLEFNGEDLQTVVSEFERYTHKQILIVGDDVARMRIGGVFKAGDVEALTAAVDMMLPVKVVRTTPYVTILMAED